MADSTSTVGLDSTQLPRYTPTAATTYDAATPATTSTATPAPSTTAPAPPVTVPSTTQYVSQVAKPATETMRDITDNETVAGHMNKLLDQNSTYMQSARANANVASNSRGLINSSMAVGASQKAAIDSALPIAQQDAATYAASGLSAQNANQNNNSLGYKSLLDSAQQRENFEYTTASNAQNIQGNKDLQTSELAAKKALQTQAEGAQLQLQREQNAARMKEIQEDLIGKQALQDAALANNNAVEAAKIKADMERLQAELTSRKTLQDEAATAAINLANTNATNQSGLLELEYQLKENLQKLGIESNPIEKAKLDLQTKQALSANLAPVMDLATRQIAAIETATGMTSDEKNAAITRIRGQMELDLESIAALYGATIDFSNYIA